MRYHMRLLSIMATAVVVTVTAASPLSAEEPATIVHAARIIVAADQPAIEPGSVVVRNGRIVATVAGPIEAAAAVAGPDARRVEVGPATVAAGFIDSHVHLTYDPKQSAAARFTTVEAASAALTGARNARTMLAQGFTTVRDVGSWPPAATALRDAIRRGDVEGPRMLVAGPPISIVGGHGDANGFKEGMADAVSRGNICTGPEACREVVRALVRSGVDLIKIHDSRTLFQAADGLEGEFEPEELVAIITTAHRLGRRVAVHAHGAHAVRDAARAGADSIEHATLADADAMDAVKAAGATIVPTLVAITWVGEQPGTASDPSLAAAVASVGEQVRLAHERKVPIANGSDVGIVPFERAGEELQLLAKVGRLTPREVLAAATTNAARLLGLEREVGALRPGMSADLVVLGGDPRSDIAAFGKVQAVMARGRWISTPAESQADRRPK